MSILGVMVAMVIILISVMAAFQIAVNYRASIANADSSDAANDMMNVLVSNISNKDFYELASYCRAKSALGVQRTGSCVVAGSLSTAASALPKDIEYQLEIPLDVKGQPTTVAPRYCAELITCRALAAGHILEISLNEWWKDPRSQLVKSKNRKFRRTKW